MFNSHALGCVQVLSVFCLSVFLPSAVVVLCRNTCQKACAVYAVCLVAWFSLLPRLCKRILIDFIYGSPNATYLAKIHIFLLCKYYAIIFLRYIFIVVMNVPWRLVCRIAGESCFFVFVSFVNVPYTDAFHFVISPLSPFSVEIGFLWCHGLSYS